MLNSKKLLDFEQHSHIGSLLCVLVGAIFAVRPYFVFLFSTSSVIPDSVYGDYGTLQLPLREFIRNEFLAGRVPLWIPYLGCGMPIHASQQASVTYPLLTPFVILLGANFGIKFSVFIHVLIAYFGQYVLCRKLGISVFASCFAGIVTAQSGFFTSHLMVGHLTVIVAYCWLPWLIVSILRLSRSPSPRSAAILAIVTVLIVLSGHPQIPYYAALLGLVCGIINFGYGQSKHHQLRYLTWMSSGIVLALLVLAIQILPTVELLQDGMQASERKLSSFASSFSLTPIELSRIVFPRIKGMPFTSSPLFEAHDAFHEETPYLGILPLLLFLFAITRKNTKSWELVVAFFVIISILISLGDSTPFFEYALTIVPGLSLFRCPGRIFSVTSILIPLVAASGLDNLIDRTKLVGGYRAVALVASFFLVGNFLGWYFIQDLEQQLSTGFQDYFWKFGYREVQYTSVLIAASYVSLWLLSRCQRHRWIPAIMLLAVLVIDLEYGSVGMIQLNEEQPQVIPEDILEELEGYRYFDASNKEFDVVNQLRYSKMVPTAINQSASMLGANEGGVFPKSMERLHQAISKRPGELLPIASSRYVLRSDLQYEKISETIDRIRFIPVNDSRVASIPIEKIRLDEIPENAEFRYEILDEDPRHITLNVNCTTSGLVCLSDIYYPGWTCLIDGQPAPIIPLHGVFRSVKVSATAHQIEFIYNPMSFQIGMWIALLGIIGILVCLIKTEKPAMNDFQQSPEIMSEPNIDTDHSSKPARSLILGLTGITLTLLVPLLADTIRNKSAPRVYYGDEPHYLIMVNSLINDGDLDLRNNYAAVHVGGLDAGERSTSIQLDHHSVCYVDNKLIRWDHVYLGFNESWDRDDEGNAIPTLREGTDSKFQVSREYSYHSPGSALLTAAFLLPFKNTEYIEPVAIYFSWLVSVVAMYFFAVLLQIFQVNSKRILIVVAIVFLGTPLLHYSRSLFNEIHLALFVILAYVAFLKLDSSFLTGLFLALGGLLKLPFLVLAIPFGIALIWQRQFIRLSQLFVPIVVMILLQLVMNHQMFGGAFNMPQQWQSGNIREGAIGLMLSIEHGLIPFAPVFMLAFAHWPKFLKTYPHQGLLILAGALSYFLVIACWGDWRGGFCYGPRLIVPILPLLAIPLVMRNWHLRSIQDWGALLLVWISLNINILGSVYYEIFWNEHPLLTEQLF